MHSPIFFLICAMPTKSRIDREKMKRCTIILDVAREPQAPNKPCIDPAQRIAFYCIFFFQSNYFSFGRYVHYIFRYATINMFGVLVVVYVILYISFFLLPSSFKWVGKKVQFQCVSQNAYQSQSHSHRWLMWMQSLSTQILNSNTCHFNYCLLFTFFSSCFIAVHTRFVTCSEFIY